MSEGNWSENGCQVGVSSAARCNSQHFGTQWESKIGLSEKNLHGFGAGVDVEVQTLKTAFFLEEKKRRGRAGICLWWEASTSSQEQRALFAGMCSEENADLFQSPRAPSFYSTFLLSCEPPSLPAPHPSRVQKDSFRVCWLKQSHGRALPKLEGTGSSEPMRFHFVVS